MRRRAHDPRWAALIAALAALALSLPMAAMGASPYRLGEAPKAKPTRIVSLAPSITEIVLDLGAGLSLVGVSRYDDADEVKELPRVGGFADPAPEAILALRPDLLLVQPGPGNQVAVQRLADLGVPVLVLPLHTIEETLSSIRAVGDALHDPTGGAASARRLSDGLEAVRLHAANLPKRRVLLVYGWQPLVVAGPESFGDALLRLAGAENVVARASGPYPTLSMEAALAADPELLLDASGGHGAAAPLEEWTPRVRRLPSSALFRPGPRLAQGARELFQILHPDAATVARDTSHGSISAPAETRPPAAPSAPADIPSASTRAPAVMPSTTRPGGVAAP